MYHIQAIVVETFHLKLQMSGGSLDRRINNVVIDPPTNSSSRHKPKPNSLLIYQVEVEIHSITGYI